METLFRRHCFFVSTEAAAPDVGQELMPLFFCTEGRMPSVVLGISGGSSPGRLSFTRCGEAPCVLLGHLVVHCCSPGCVARWGAPRIRFLEENPRDFGKGCVDEGVDEFCEGAPADIHLEPQAHAGRQMLAIRIGFWNAHGYFMRMGMHSLPRQKHIVFSRLLH